MTYFKPLMRLIRAMADIVILVLAGILLFQMFYPYEPMRIHEFNLMDGNRVVPGSIVWVELKWDKFLPLKADVTKWLVCGDRSIQISEEGGNNPTGLGKITVSPSLIPSFTQKDWDKIRSDMGGEIVCSIRATYSYKIGPFRDVSKTVETKEKFKVQ
jgi:hypothetical protein